MSKEVKVSIHDLRTLLHTAMRNITIHEDPLCHSIVHVILNHREHVSDFQVKIWRKMIKDNRPYSDIASDCVMRNLRHALKHGRYNDNKK